MPQLPKPFTAQIGGIEASGGRRATAQDFGAPGLGDAGMVGAGHQIQNAAQAQLAHMEETEARTALVSSTQVRAEYARKLDEAALSGADLGALKEEMAASLSKIGENFQTKKGSAQLQLYTANSEIMYDQQAAQISVQRAWTQAKVDGTKFVASASALIQSNPAYLAVAEKNAEDFIATFPKIRADQRVALTAELKQDLNMAAAMSAARMNPAEAKNRAEAGEWNLTPEQRRTVISSSEHYENVKRAADEREVQRVKREQDERATAARDEYTQQILNGDLGGALQKKIIADPRFATHPEYREHLVTFMRADAKRLAGQEKQSDQTVKRDLYTRLVAPDGTPDKLFNSDEVYNQLKAGKLNVTDANFLIGIASGQKDENGKRFSSRLGTAVSGLRAAMANDPRTKAFDAETVAAIQMVIASGAERRAQELRSGADGPARSADGMFDPASKDFYFKPGLLKDAADTVNKQRLEQATAGAARVTSVEQLLAVPDGAAFIDDSGTPKVMTPAIRKQFSGKKGPTTEFPFVPSGETPFAQERRAAERRGQKYHETMGNK